MSFKIDSSGNIDVNKNDIISFNVNYTPNSTTSFVAGDKLVFKVKKDMAQSVAILTKEFTTFDDKGFNVTLLSSENILDVGSYVYTLTKININNDNIETLIPVFPTQIARLKVYDQ